MDQPFNYLESLTLEQLEMYRDQCLALASKAETHGALNKALTLMNEAEMYDKHLTQRQG